MQNPIKQTSNNNRGRPPHRALFMFGPLTSNSRVLTIVSARALAPTSVSAIQLRVRTASEHRHSVFMAVAHAVEEAVAIWLPHAPTAGAVAGARRRLAANSANVGADSIGTIPVSDVANCCRGVGPSDRREQPVLSMLRLLVVTNDFPPRIGGIEEYVAELVRHLSSDISTTVLTSQHLDAASFDRSFPARVIRWAPYPLLPTPRLVQAVVEQVSHDQVDVLAFGATLPLAFIAGAVRGRTGVPVVMLTHGVEPALTSLPGGPAVLRRLARHATIVTVLSRWAEHRIRSAVGSLPRIELLRSGVDADRFQPNLSGATIRQRYGLGTGPGHRQRRQAGSHEKDTIGSLPRCRKSPATSRPSACWSSGRARPARGFRAGDPVPGRQPRGLCRSRIGRRPAWLFRRRRRLCDALPIALGGPRHRRPRNGVPSSRGGRKASAGGPFRRGTRSCARRGNRDCGRREHLGRGRSRHSAVAESA